MKKVVLVDNEKGFALVLALVFMLAMTVIGISVVTNMSTEMHIASNEKDAKVAFQVSEAGFQEALGRIHLAQSSALYAGEPVSTDPDYRTTNWLETFTSSEGDLDYTVTIRYLVEPDPTDPDNNHTHGFCDSNTASGNTLAGGANPADIPPATCVQNGEIVYFGQDFNVDPATSTLKIGQFPVYEIISVGTAGGSNTIRTVTAYVGSTNLDLDTGFAIDTNKCISIAGGSATITGPIQNDDDGCATCESADGCTDRAELAVMDEYLGLPMADIQGMSDETHYCVNSPCSGSDDIPSSGMIDGVVQDWGDYATDTYGSYIYIDAGGSNTVTISGNFQGRGLLVVDGNLKISGNFDFEGLVYVKGTLTLSGGGSSTNITGGLVANETVQINGGLIVTYDQATLEDISRQNKSQALLLWKRN